MLASEEKQSHLYLFLLSVTIVMYAEFSVTV